MPTKSTELQRLAPEKDLSCCPWRPLLPFTAHTGKERIKHSFGRVFFSFPVSHKHVNAHTKTCSPLLTYFPFTCMWHTHLAWQSQVFLEAAIHTLPRTLWQQQELFAWGRPLGVKVTPSTLKTHKAFRLFSQAWHFLGVGAASSVSSLVFWGFFSILFNGNTSKEAQREAQLPWLASTQGSQTGWAPSGLV